MAKEGDITRRARERWKEKVPGRDSCDRLSWLVIRDVLWPMLREMADEIEELREQAARRKGSEDGS